MGRPAGVVAMVALLLLGGRAWGADPVAVLTEIRMGQGEVSVKPAGDGDWILSKPLLALRAGDQVRATLDARAVLVFTGGRGTQVVSAANSPFAIQPPTAETGSERLRAVVAGVTQFLLGQQRQLTYQSLSVRSLRQPPLILSPRDTLLLPGPVTFEWAGSDRLRYTVRVLGPGVVWEEANLVRRPFEYPASAPALRPGVQYVWELTAPGHPAQRAQFQLLPSADATRVQSALSLLEPGVLADYPRSTVILMRAGLLFQERLYHEARRELLAGVAADRDEPTLHLLLGSVYERIGLKDLAAQEFEEAQHLSTRKP